ncbi:GNAT family N-acetyltransferase [Desmonostoc muscorum LEGE 12446]|uniref:GNAT family N-acetyltransferase n=1 Tax=Desmonostoc muscorum LEGE 12446 TaxID=1828758 RepID=A0A8J6ZV29_DESMC|nr:GNAT family N-acetyltransferase [Desmonostoc muscorum]MCF2150506.1 GNAT family N-acetyltransferase [Desmonostoc muscorum LEGE 12446]
MKVYRFQNATEFYARVKDYLLNQEAMHNLLLGISHTLIENPERFEEKPYLSTVEVNGDIVAVAMRTPPRPLLLSEIKDFQAVELLAQDLSISYPSLPGVNAPTDEAQAFTLAWHSLTGQSYQLKVALRTFKLEKVKPISQVTGYLRLATEDDRELLKNWHEAFSLEALGEIELDAERWVQGVLRQGTAYLWQDEVAVSIACHGGTTPNGARVGMVYTPPEHRRRGYASASVAALSQTLLDRGNRFCFLFTDLANPTSNHIYQEIGYQPVGDWHNYSFV